MAERSKKGGRGGDAKSGEVSHDTRGNAVWQWAVETGKHALDSTSALLKRLDLPGLSLQEDEPVSKPAAPTDAGLEVEKRQGYDPYGRQKRSAPTTADAPVARAPGVPPRPAAPRAVSPPSPAPAPRPSSWWSRFFSRR